MAESVFGGISAFVAALTLFIGWRAFRAGDLRNEEVLDWSNRAICTMQSLLLSCLLAEKPFFKAESARLLVASVVDTSVLIEQGRLFFKNVLKGDGHGDGKPSAYRGYRPELLDSLVIAHQIACQWSDADERDRRKMIALLELEVKRFVSVVQKEVGRQRTASGDTKIGGRDINLKMILAQTAEPGGPSPRDWL